MLKNHYVIRPILCNRHRCFHSLIKLTCNVHNTLFVDVVICMYTIFSWHDFKMSTKHSQKICPVHHLKNQFICTINHQQQLFSLKFYGWWPYLVFYYWIETFHLNFGSLIADSSVLGKQCSHYFEFHHNHFCIISTWVRNCFWETYLGPEIGKHIYLMPGMYINVQVYASDRFIKFMHFNLVKL